MDILRTLSMIPEANSTECLEACAWCENVRPFKGNETASERALARVRFRTNLFSVRVLCSSRDSTWGVGSVRADSRAAASPFPWFRACGYYG